MPATRSEDAEGVFRFVIGEMFCCFDGYCSGLGLAFGSGKRAELTVRRATNERNGNNRGAGGSGLRLRGSEDGNGENRGDPEKSKSGACALHGWKDSSRRLAAVQ